LNRQPLGYEPIVGLHALQRATARRRENARLAPATLALAVGRRRQFSGRNPVADRPLARERTRRTSSGSAIAPSRGSHRRDIIAQTRTRNAAGADATADATATWVARPPGGEPGRGFDGFLLVLQRGIASPVSASFRGHVQSAPDRPDRVERAGVSAGRERQFAGPPVVDPVLVA
jgi:hypothetical protein